MIVTVGAPYGASHIKSGMTYFTTNKISLKLG